MYRRQKYRLINRADSKLLLIAVLFLCSSLVSALVRADVKSIEGLEFSRVQLVGSNQLEIRQGDVIALKIRGDEGELEPLPFIVQGDTLRLGITQRGNETSDVKFKLTVTGLEALLVQGSAEAFVKPLAVEQLLVSLEGSGVIRMFDVQATDLEMRVIGSGAVQAANVKAGNARLNLKGSGDIQLGSLQAKIVKTHMAGSGDITVQRKSSADLLEVRVLGSGDVGLKRLTAIEADVTIMGSGDIEVRVQDRLDAEVLGSGDLTYYGTPTASTSVLGSGDVRRKD